MCSVPKGRIILQGFEPPAHNKKMLYLHEKLHQFGPPTDLPHRHGGGYFFLFYHEKSDYMYMTLN